MAKRAATVSTSADGLVIADANANGASVGSIDPAPSIAAAGNDGLIVIDPASLGGGAGGDNGSAGDNSGEPVRKRRGRKPGSVGGGKTQALDINGVESILLSAHTMLAAITKTQELALDKAEANQLATAIANVSRHYDIAATQKSMDWGNLIMCLGMVYGTRIYAIRARRPPRQKNAAPQHPATETIIPGVGPAFFDPSSIQ